MRALTTRPYGRRDAAPPSGSVPIGHLVRLRRAAADLTPQAIEQIAQRVAELLRGDGAGRDADALARLLDAEQLAKHLGLNRAWVYQHAAELGALRIGDGPRARLRFDLQTVTARLAMIESAGVAPTMRVTQLTAPPRHAPASTTPLLPITPRRVRGVRPALHPLVRRIRDS